ncbi:MAG: transglutaminase domain-containing protein [Dehalococcoidia bacterium]
MEDNRARGRRSTARRIFGRYFPLFVILWIVFVLYPNPLNFFLSIHRAANPGVDPGAVEFMLVDLPSDPAAIDRAVLAGIPYGYDWEVYGMPWYFPTIEQVLSQGKGDCKARALVLASVFEAKGIPYLVNISPIHMWVEYEGKQETATENPDVSFHQRDPQTGETRFQTPNIEVRQVADSARRGFWTAMPVARKALLISGLAVLIAARIILFIGRKRARVSTT